MEKDTSVGAEASIVTWETLESFVRVKVQAFVQDLLEEEVTELLGRGKSVRREAVDASPATATGTASRAGSRCGAARSRSRDRACHTLK